MTGGADGFHHDDRVGDRVQDAEREASERRQELALALDHLQESLADVEARIESLRELSENAFGRLSRKLGDTLRDALRTLDQDAFASWFLVFMTGCAFGGLLVFSGRTKTKTRAQSRVLPNSAHPAHPMRMDESAADLTDEDIEKAA